MSQKKSDSSNKFWEPPVPATMSASTTAETLPATLAAEVERLTSLVPLMRALHIITYDGIHLAPLPYAYPEERAQEDESTVVTLRERFGRGRR